MGRSNGEFPNYVKLEISTEEWPDDYWSKARQCDNCGTCWPHVHLFQKAPCCGVPTTSVVTAPDMRWPEAIKELLRLRFEELYEEFNEGTTDDELALDDVITNGEPDDEKIKEQVELFLSEV